MLPFAINPNKPVEKKLLTYSKSLFNVGIAGFVY
jgi:hypothetical protein